MKYIIASLLFLFWFVIPCQARDIEIGWTYPIEDEPRITHFQVVMDNPGNIVVDDIDPSLRKVVYQMPDTPEYLGRRHDFGIYVCDDKFCSDLSETDPWFPSEIKRAGNFLIINIVTP